MEEEEYRDHTPLRNHCNHTTHTHTQEAARTCVWSDAAAHVCLSVWSLCLLPGGSAGSTLHHHSWLLLRHLCRTAVLYACLLLLDSSGSSPSLPEACEGVWCRCASLRTVGLYHIMGYDHFILNKILMYIFIPIPIGVLFTDIARYQVVRPPPM